MRVFLWLTAAFLLLALKAFAQGADAVTGEWLTDGGESKIQIYKTTSGKFAGRIVWLKEPSDAKGPKKDENNPDASLRGRQIQGLVILQGLTFEDGQWVGGTIYDPKKGKTYSCQAKLEGNKLALRGYVMGMPFLGRTTSWTRQ